MRPSTLGNVLLIAGAAVGVAAIAAVVIDFSPNLTAEMIKLLFYKGLGAASVGLMIVGTLMARAGREREKQRDITAAEANLVRVRQPSDPMLHDETPGIDSIGSRDSRERVARPSNDLRS